MPPSRQIDDVELFLSTESNKFSYKGLRKVDIKLGPKVLIIKQNDKDKSMIEIPFYYPFIMHKYLLCHVSPTKLHDIVLIFPTKTACKDVYNILVKYQIKIQQEIVEGSNKYGELKDRILTPLYKEVIDNPNVNESTRSYILQMAKPVNAPEDGKNIMVKSELSEPPNELQCEMTGSPIILQMPYEDVEVLSTHSRKRKNRTKNSDVALDISSANKKCKAETPEEVLTPKAVGSNMESSNLLSKRYLNNTEFETRTLYKKGNKKLKLLVYCSADKKLCYSYYFETKGKRFVCDSCKEKNRYVVAHLRQRQNAEQFIELGLLNHICTPIPYTQPPQTFDLLCDIEPRTPNINANNSILSLPCSSTTAASSSATCTNSITLPESINTNNDFPNILMEIKREITEVSESVSRNTDPVITDSNIVSQKPKILKTPDYEIQKFVKAGEFKQRLVVFYPENRKFCFSYTFEAANNRFACVRCRRNRRSVVAYVRYDSNGNQYIELGPLYHLCPPLYYNIIPEPDNALEDANDSPSNKIVSDEIPGISSDNSSPIYRSSESPADVKNIEGINETCNNRDEPTSSTMKAEFDEESELSSPDTSVIKSPNFEIQMVNKNRKIKPQLLVFPYSDKQLCYYYYYDTPNDYFICGKCRKRLHYVIARLKKDKNGEDFVTLDNKPHICLPMPYQNVNETSDDINVYSIEEMKRRNLRREIKTGKKSNEPIDAKNLKSELSESIPNDDVVNDMEYPISSNVSSNESTKSDSDEDYTEDEDYDNDTDTEGPQTFETKKTLDSSQFECQKFMKKGQERFKLITFVSFNKKYCYIYYHDVCNNRFVCSKCRKQQHNVYAFLRDGDDNEKYVKLGLREHICKPLIYSPPCVESKQRTLNSDEYELTYTREGRLRPIIFASKDKTLCYEFCPNQKGIFICCGCGNKTGAASINVVEEDNLYKISLRNPRHICEPRKYMKNKNQEKVLMPGKFKFYRDTVDSGELKLITFPFEGDNEKCRIFQYSTDDKLFRCINCQNVNAEVIAKIFINIHGEEYIIDRASAEHLCTPSIYSDLDQSQMEIASSSGLDVKKLKTRTWNENHILKAGNFELQRNRYGTLNATLIVFVPEDRKLCYRYYFDNYSKHYLCNNCREKFKIKVTAKLYDDGDEKYLKLGTYEHRCEPVEYEAERKIIKKPNYILWDLNNIIVFPSSNREKCYHYCSKKLHCNPCRRKNKDVTVMLLVDENGEECLQLGKNEHLCEPQKIENVAMKIGVEVEDILSKIVV